MARCESLSSSSRYRALCDDAGRPLIPKHTGQMTGVRPFNRSARARRLRSDHHRTGVRHRVTEAEHALDKGVIELCLDGALGVRGSHRAQAGTAKSASSRANPCAATAPDRSTQPCAERCCQCGRAKPAQISALRLICHHLLSELPANGLIILEA
jgi:hypothetical protein